MTAAPAAGKEPAGKASHGKAPADNVRARHLLRRARTRPRPAAGTRSDESGSAVIEYALLTLAVFTLIFLGIQVALYAYARSVALTAAQEAVAAQRAYGAAPDAGRARANAIVGAQGDVLGHVSVSVATDGNTVTATVAGTSISLFPGLPGFTVRQAASGPIEGFHR